MQKQLTIPKELQVVDIDSDYLTLILNEGSLTIECPWRLIESGIGIITGENEYRQEATQEKEGQILREVILNQKIATISIKDFPCDLNIEFVNKVILEILPCSGLYESWNLTIEHRNWIGLPGGREVAEF